MPQLLSKGGSTSVRTRRGSLSGLTSSDAAAAASIGFARGPPQYVNARCRLGNSRRRSTAVAFGAKRTLTEIAGEALAIADTLTDLEAALLACWVPPPMEQSRLGMQITVLMSFKRNGELFEQPRITFQSREAYS